MAKDKKAPPRIVTPGKLDDKKLVELRNAILDGLVEHGFIDDDDSVLEDIGDVLQETIDLVLGRP